MLRIKRKATEDPPDYLVVQKRHFTGITLHFQRLQDAPFNTRNSSSIVGNLLNSGVSAPSHHEVLQLEPSLVPLSEASLKHRSLKDCRQFCLTPEARHDDWSLSNLSDNGPGTHERQLGLPLESRETRENSIDKTTLPGLSGNDGDHRIVSSSPRKRPNVSTQEREWQSQTWGHSVSDEPTASARVGTASKESVDSRESSQLASELQHFSMQITPQHDSRFQPKSPPPRRSDAVKVSPKNSDFIGTEDNEWIYETYLRRVLPINHIEASVPNDAMDLLDAGNVGVLILDEQDEKIWQELGEEVEDDEKVASDDDDENAEEYYGNDYPEDEVESEDEYGRDAYRYHASHADYGASWSDSEGEKD